MNETKILKHKSSKKQLKQIYPDQIPLNLNQIFEVDSNFFNRTTNYNNL